MPRFAPTPEMLDFASAFGGVLVRDASIAFGRLLGADPALAFGLDLLEDFDGVRNAEGLIFRSDLQLLDSTAPMVVSGLANGRFCVGVSAGYTARVAEVSAAAVHLSLLGVDSALRSIPDIGDIGSRYLTSIEPALDALLRPLHRAGHSQKQVYLSNLMVVFGLVREIRAIVDGHVPHAARSRHLSSSSRARLQSFQALDVDCDAFAFVLMNLLRGLPFFEVAAEGFSNADRVRAFQLAVMLLSCIETEGTPGAACFGELTGADRVINFANLPVHLAMALPDAWDTLVGLERGLQPTARALAASAPIFAPMAAPGAREERARHERWSEELMGSSDVRRARSSFARFAFAPKNMPTA